MEGRLPGISRAGCVHPIGSIKSEGQLTGETDGGGLCGFCKINGLCWKI